MHRAVSPSQLSCNVSSIVFTLQLNGCGGASLTVITWLFVDVCFCFLVNFRKVQFKQIYSFCFVLFNLKFFFMVTKSVNYLK